MVVWASCRKFASVELRKGVFRKDELVLRGVVQLVGSGV